MDKIAFQRKLVRIPPVGIEPTLQAYEAARPAPAAGVKVLSPGLEPGTSRLTGGHSTVKLSYDSLFALCPG